MFEILRFITRDLSKDEYTDAYRNMRYYEDFNLIQIFYKGTIIFESFIGFGLHDRGVLYLGSNNRSSYHNIKHNEYPDDIENHDDTELLYLIRNATDENIKTILRLQDHEYRHILDAIQDYKSNLISNNIL